MNFPRLVDIAKAFKLTKQTGRSFHVAFILKGRKVISIGFNDFTKRNRLSSLYKPTRNHMADYQACVHAEVNSLAKLRRRESVRDLTLVSIRINNHGKLAYAEPCPNCAYHLGLKRLDNVFYSTNDETFARMN